MWELRVDGELAMHIAGEPVAAVARRRCSASSPASSAASSPASIAPISEFLNPLIVFFNAISGIVWLPLVIGWLGIGTALAVFLIWNTVFFIVFQNTVLGVQLVPQVYEQGVQALGGGRWETIRTVILPGALPYILTGIRSGPRLRLARADRRRAGRRHRPGSAR